MTKAAQRIRNLLSTPAQWPDTTNARPLPAAAGAVYLRDVGYRYCAGGAWVLRHFNAEIAPGSRVAITGPSGSGKSTLLSLLLRIMDPGEGTISFGDIRLTRADPAQLQRRIALLSQFSPVFMGSIRSNLQMGADQASDAQLWDALAQAQLADYVRTLGEGLDTWVGEAGQALSVGQARRLCLARILLTPAQIWLLDEPTAGLDTATAQRFFQDLVRVAGARTLIIATHADLPTGLFDQTLSLNGPGRSTRA